ncbi:hypothetical protein [Oceanospirillum sediminis]|uniref:Uncharacterized protein n=1 Tax=Oceanospirillum sediminis TaxID=2760088 RepID=A0A839INP2_9GAMM|nr:hypothetical protein [Oceanospirillum sediminis]MBB1485896.1 hypothetical protein [Oceanospirillum sediminis]
MTDITINSTTLTFPKIWYCNAETGDDFDTGDGSASAPFKTLARCNELASAGDAIKLQAVSDPETYRYPANFKLEKNISFIGEENKAIIGANDSESFFSSSNAGLIRFYQCTFKGKEGFRSCSQDSVIECYACVTDLNISAWGYPYGALDNLRFFNCLVLGAKGENAYENGVRDHATFYDSVILATQGLAGYGDIRLVRSWVNGQFFTDSVEGAFTPMTFDENYSINGDYTLTSGFSSGHSDVGVYSGDFSWDGNGASNPVMSFLFRNASGAAFKYDAGSFVQVNASEPTETDFITHGMNSIPDISISELAAWEPSGQFALEYYDSGADSNSVKQLRITSVPKARIALPKNTISVSGVSELNGINIVQNLAATGASRFVVSVDGSSWKAWNGSSWVDLNALAVDQNSADYLMANGMTEAQVAALSWTELQQLYTGNPTAIAVAYAVEAKAINDTAEIDHVELTVTHSGQKWVRDHGQIELEITGSHFTATPAINCTYKVNYQDAI